MGQKADMDLINIHYNVILFYLSVNVLNEREKWLSKYNKKTKIKWEEHKKDRM
jgi:hypothetical protein